MANSAGINRYTGKQLTDWDHVVQSCWVIFTTALATRVMRRTFGSAIPGLLGRNLNPQTVLAFFTAIIVCLTLWEPRFRVIQVIYPLPGDDPEHLRAGLFEFQLIGQYIPRALKGDFTPEPIPRTLPFRLQVPGQ